MKDANLSPWNLQDASLALRLVIAVFLASVGIGYCSALVNLHFQEASPGNPLPDAKDVIRAYHGEDSTNQIARLLNAPESLPFNGAGSMRGAFTQKKNPGALKTGVEEILAQLKDGGYKSDPTLRQSVKEAVDSFFDFERLAVFFWAIEGHPREAYDADDYNLPSDLASDYRKFRAAFVEKLKPLRPVPPGDSPDPSILAVNDFITLDDDGIGVSSRIRGIIEERCVRCHDHGKSVSSYPLSRYEHLKVYLDEDFGAEKGKSLPKLALSTHVHLLGFSVLYGLTGIVFALTGYPWWVKLFISPAPLLFQIIDISFWWLARMDAPLGPLFAQGIMATGGLVAVSLVAQILLGLFSLFNGKEKLVLLIVCGIGATIGLSILIFAVMPHLQKEKVQSGIQSSPVTWKP
jgi:hypothetical protein